MINLRQIAVLFGTAAAAVAVVILPDSVVAREQTVVVEATPTRPARQPASDRLQPLVKSSKVQVSESSDEPPEEGVEARKTSTIMPRAPVAKEQDRLAEVEARMAEVVATYKKAVEQVNKKYRIPASVEIVTVPPERYSELSFTPEMSFSRIDGHGIGNNSTAKLLSNINLGGDVFWRQHWSERLNTRLGMGFSRVDFQGAPNSKTITQAGKTFGRFGLGASYRIGDRWEAGAGVGIQQEVFYQAVGATALRVDQVAVPRAEASLRYDLISLAPFRVGVGARSAFLFPTSADGYAVKAGSSHRFSVHLKEENLDGRLRPTGEIFYDWKKQNTNLNSKSEKELGMRLGLTWKFGP